MGRSDWYLPVFAAALIDNDIEEENIFIFSISQTLGRRGKNCVYFFNFHFMKAAISSVK